MDLNVTKFIVLMIKIVVKNAREEGHYACKGLLQGQTRRSRTIRHYDPLWPLDFHKIPPTPNKFPS